MTGSHSTDTDAAPATTLAIEAPEMSLVDEPICVRITGVEPDAPVEFTARLLDDDGDIWDSTATFTADDAGTADLGRDAPDHGDWTDAHPMAWLWAMTTEADGMGASLGETPDIGIDLHAETPDQETTRTITRRLYDPDITQTTVEADGVHGVLFEPPGDDPTPGIMTLHGSAGRRSFRSSRILATHGYTVLALDYIGDQDALPDHIANIDLAYFDTAADFLLDQSRVTGDRLGLVGVSRGAEAAILLGAHRDWVGAVISYAGSIPWDTPHDAPAWLDNGEPVPHIVADDNHPNKTDLDAKPLRDVVPPVEHTNGPILILSGGSDPVWDARRLSQVIADHLDDHDVTHDYTHLTYDDVGHYIGIPYVPLGGLGDFTRARGTAHAGEDSWPRVLDYLERGLRDPIE